MKKTTPDSAPIERPADPNQLAKFIVDLATSAAEDRKIQGGFSAPSKYSLAGPAGE